MDRFCSQCGTALVQQTLDGRVLPVCPACGHVVWGHFSLVAGGLLVHEGRVLFIQRNIEPDAGQWTLPGGYVQPGEALDQAAVREVREEAGLQVAPTGLLGIWQTPGKEMNTCWCVFGVQLTGPISDLRPDPVEIRAVRFFLPDELNDLEHPGRWSRWMAQHYRPEDAIFCRQEIDEGIKPYLSNSGVTLFCLSGKYNNSSCSSHQINGVE